MSWWDSNNFSSFATQAIKSAQKKIDKVLDIEDNPNHVSAESTSLSLPPEKPTAPSESETGDTFWNNWFQGTEQTEDQSKNPPNKSTKNIEGKQNIPSVTVGSTKKRTSVELNDKTEINAEKDSPHDAKQSQENIDIANVSHSDDDTSTYQSDNAISLQTDALIVTDVTHSLQEGEEKSNQYVTSQTVKSNILVSDVIAMDVSMSASAWGDSELPDITEEMNDLETEVSNININEPNENNCCLDIEHGTHVDSTDEIDADKLVGIAPKEDITSYVKEECEPQCLTENTDLKTEDSKQIIDMIIKDEKNPSISEFASQFENENSSKSSIIKCLELVTEKIPESLMDKNEEINLIKPINITIDTPIDKTPDSETEGTLQISSDSNSASDGLSDSNRTLTGDDFIDSCDSFDVNQSECLDIHETVNILAAAESNEMGSASSLVKTMIEDAMSESLKEIDAHSSGSSDKSSEMVRIESGMNSGHTSGDEIDTTTSSDIEIISTPTPNGDQPLERPFDLSPLRHALTRSVRHSSPPGHKRSDSSSSGYSNFSRNGDDLISPETSRAQSEYLTHQGLGMSCQSTDPLQTEKLLRKLAEMSEIVDARERKMVELSRENIDLQESNAILRNQLVQCDEVRQVEHEDIEQVTTEFTHRLSEYESKLNSAIREKECICKTLQEKELVLAKKNDSIFKSEQLITEKDEQIAELLTEGEKLSKQQLQSNNIIKKLRSKEKDNESLLKSNKLKLETNKTEIDHLKKVLDSKEDLERRQIDAIHQLNQAVKVMESETLKLKSESDDSQEKSRSLQVALDNSYKEIAELHKGNASKDSAIQHAALSAEVSAREELKLNLDKQQSESRHHMEHLLNQIEDLRLSLSRQEKESSRHEDLLRQEISDLQQQLQQGDDRNQELTQSITAATRPLLRQIGNLNSTHGAQINVYERVELNLTERLGEAQTALAAAVEKERGASEQLLEITTRIATMESSHGTARQQVSRLTARLEMECSKSHSFEEARNNETAKLETIKYKLEEEISGLRLDANNLQRQLDLEKIHTENEEKKFSLLQDQLRDKDLMIAKLSSNSPHPGSRSHSRQPSIDCMVESVSSQDEFLGRTLNQHSDNLSKINLYDSMRHTSAASLIENLEAQLKMREGEIVQLQSDINELEHTREAMAQELVKLTTENQQLMENVVDYPSLRVAHSELDQRYQALLQMYGEKVEETDELRLDLNDVKDMYKAQIEELIKNINR